MSQCYEPRQIVRPIGKLERIPDLSTFDLLISPIRPAPQPLGVNEIRKQQAHEKFAPHIDYINSMRSRGVSIRKIARDRKICHVSLSRYMAKNPGLFK